LLSQAGVRDTLALESVGATMDNLNTRILAKIRLPIPPTHEQRLILSFVERETVRIDRLADVRRKQVECLHQQRTAVIHDAVTKGLDPHVTMRPSGAEWLGDMPAKWNRYRIRHLLRPGKDGIRIGPFGSSLKAEFIREEGYKVYGQENVIGRSFELGTRYIDESKYLALREYAIRARDVLITMMGSIGRCIVVPDGIANGIMDSHLIRIGVDTRRIDAHYLALLIEAAPYVGANIEYESKGSIMDGLNSAIVKQLLILLPTIQEQRSIMKYIASETAHLDTLASKYRRELELLGEYRASLISHAVTGKIDVRELVALDEPEPAECL
jgi:type I restriction enzyme S subunit